MSLWNCPGHSTNETEFFFRIHLVGQAAVPALGEPWLGFAITLHFFKE